MLDTMTKEKFIYYIKEIQSYEKKVRNINDVMAKNCEDNIYCPPSLEHVVVDMMEEAFNDSNKLIDYFIYDLRFGHKWFPGLVLRDGSKAKLETEADLYDRLIEQMERSK